MAETIGVVGGGALGTLLMKHFLGAGMRVHALEQNPARRSALAHDFPDLLVTEEAASLRPASTIFLCIKSYDTAHVAKGLRALQPLLTAICSLQNGWGNLETLEQEIPGTPLLAGATALGAYLDEQGALHGSTRGVTLVAPWGETPARRAEQVVRVLVQAGLTAEARPDARAILWQKLTLNAAVNPLTAIASRPNGALLEEPGLMRLAERAALEAARIGGKLGHVDPHWDPRPDLRTLLDETRANRSSMAEDLARGRRTEIDAIAGAIVEAAGALGEPVPVLEALLTLVRGAEPPTS